MMALSEAFKFPADGCRTVRLLISRFLGAIRCAAIWIVHIFGKFQLRHHQAVALPEEAAFRLLRDADASEPLLVLLSGLSSETSYRDQPFGVLLEGGFAA
jgi:hypothetical protein